MTEQLFYIEILNREFDQRKKKNSRYSLRAYARDLGLAPSFLQEILKIKKGLSEKAAEKIILSLELSKIEGRAFKSSVASEHSRDKKKKILAKKDFNQSKFILNSKVISEDVLKHANHWLYQAILETLSLEDGDKSASWLSKKLGIAKDVIDGAIKNLMQINWVEEKNGQLMPTFANSVTSNDISSDAIKAFHISALEKSKQAVFEQTVQEREMQNCILAFPTSEMIEAKEMIRSFIHEFNQKYSTIENRDSVYQMSIQFVKLTK